MMLARSRHLCPEGRCQKRLTAAEAKLQEIGKPREPEAGNHAAKVNTRGKRA